MKKSRFAFYSVILSAGVFLVALGCATMESSKPYPMVPRMSIEELKNRLGDLSLIILDARQNKDWDKSSLKIKGAVRELPADLIRWQPTYPKDKTIVVYCA